MGEGTTTAVTVVSGQFIINQSSLALLCSQCNVQCMLAAYSLSPFPLVLSLSCIFNRVWIERERERERERATRPRCVCLAAAAAAAVTLDTSPHTSFRLDLTRLGTLLCCCFSCSCSCCVCMCVCVFFQLFLNSGRDKIGDRESVGV